MKYYGQIGFTETQEISPGVWDEVIVEHSYYGDIYRKSRRLNDSGYINGEIDYSIELSILADPYARNHIDTMRYVTMDNTKWVVQSVDPTSYPRLTLSIGGVYNDGVRGTEAERDTQSPY